jgi:hypothetical protein
MLLVLLGALTAGYGYAQFRTLPQNAKYAVVGEIQPLPFVQLDGKLYKLAPGGVIYNEENRTIVHGSLPSGVRVAYSVDLGGDIGRIYILTALEQAQADSKQ